MIKANAQHISKQFKISMSPDKTKLQFQNVHNLAREVFHTQDNSMSKKVAPSMAQLNIKLRSNGIDLYTTGNNNSLERHQPKFFSSQTEKAAKIVKKSKRDLLMEANK